MAEFNMERVIKYLQSPFIKQTAKWYIFERYLKKKKKEIPAMIT